MATEGKLWSCATSSSQKTSNQKAIAVAPAEVQYGFLLGWWEVFGFWTRVGSKTTRFCISYLEGVGKRKQCGFVVHISLKGLFGFLSYVCECLVYMYVSVPCSLVSTEGIQSCGTWWLGTTRPSSWKLIPRPLQEQQAPLTAERSPHPLLLSFYLHIQNQIVL